jgi:hypothetical protein
VKFALLLIAVNREHGILFVSAEYGLQTRE